MKRAGVLRDRLFVALTLCAIVMASFAIFPHYAHADTPLNILTVQLIPPGENTCPQQQVLVFTTYVYENTLDAVEYTISDSSYVALVASVGDQSIPFQYITRQFDAAGNLKIHLDTSANIPGSLPVDITLLSAGGGGKPTCAMHISTKITSRESTVTSRTEPAMPEPSSPQETVSDKTPSESAMTPAKPVTESPASVIGSTATSGEGETSAIVSSLENSIVAMCKGGNATGIWLALLVLYAALVAAVTLGREYFAFTRQIEWVAGIIVVPLVALFAFWYFAESCRTAAWVPAVSILIALAGLTAAFNTYPKEAQTVIPLPAAQPDKK